MIAPGGPQPFSMIPSSPAAFPGRNQTRSPTAMTFRPSIARVFRIRRTWQDQVRPSSPSTIESRPWTRTTRPATHAERSTARLADGSDVFESPYLDSSLPTTSVGRSCGAARGPPWPCTLGRGGFGTRQIVLAVTTGQVVGTRPFLTIFLERNPDLFLLRHARGLSRSLPFRLPGSRLRGARPPLSISVVNRRTTSRLVLQDSPPAPASKRRPRFRLTTPSRRGSLTSTPATVQAGHAQVTP